MNRKKGRRRWTHLHYLQDFFKDGMEDSRLPDYTREWYEKVYHLLLLHELDVEDTIEQLLEEKIRNPAFPDDLAEWLVNNFDDEEEEDEDDN